MADEQQGTPLVPQDLIDSSDWSDVQLSIPTRAQVEEEDAKEEDTDADAGKQTGTEDPEAPEPQVEFVPDPGEYVPADYSFEVTTFDDEGNKPTSHKVASVEDWDKLMESEPNFGSAVALSKAMRLASKMEINLETDKKSYDAKKADYDALAQSDTDRAEQLQTWMSEMEYLVTRGDIPKAAAKFKDAKWEGDALKDEGIKAQVDLVKYMDKENKSRLKAGLKPMTSIIDAFNSQQLSKGRTSTPSTQKKEEGKARQVAGARIAGASSNPVGMNAPKGVAVGTGGSLDDLGRGWF